MDATSTKMEEKPARVIPDYVEDELANYEKQIKKYRAGDLGETKMQKLRLQFGVLTKTKEVSIETHGFERNQAQVDRTKRIIERIWNAIQAGHFYPTPSPMNCPVCPYRDPCRNWSG